MGTVAGGVIGMDVGALGGLVVGGGSTIELGPGVVVGAGGGALYGSLAGLATGATLGGEAGDRAEDALLGLLGSSTAAAGSSGPLVWMSKSRHEREGEGTRGKTIEQIREAYKGRLTRGQLNRLIQQVEKLRGQRNKAKRGKCK